LRQEYKEGGEKRANNKGTEEGGESRPLININGHKIGQWEGEEERKRKEIYFSH